MSKCTYIIVKTLWHFIIPPFFSGPVICHNAEAEITHFLSVFFLCVCVYVCVWSFQEIATSMAMLATVDMVKETSSKPTRNLSICCRIKFGQRQTGIQLELTSPRHSFRSSDEIRIHFMLFNWYYKQYRKIFITLFYYTALYYTFGNNLCASMYQCINDDLTEGFKTSVFGLYLLCIQESVLVYNDIPRSAEHSRYLNQEDYNNWSGSPIFFLCRHLFCPPIQIVFFSPTIFQLWNWTTGLRNPRRVLAPSSDIFARHIKLA